MTVFKSRPSARFCSVPATTSSLVACLVYIRGPERLSIALRFETLLFSVSYLFTVEASLPYVTILIRR